MSATILILILVFIIVLLFARKTGKDWSTWLNPRVKVRTRIIFNGQEYSSPDEMPAEVRQAYERAMSAIADSDRDGMPDLFKAAGGRTAIRNEVWAQTAKDPVERLKKLKEMKDAGLITEQEYEAKKAEILSKM